MTPQELKAYFLHWRENRLDKLAPVIIDEFQRHSERFDALHALAISKDTYPFQEYGSWLAGHIIQHYYLPHKEQRLPEIIDAYLASDNSSIQRNLHKIINGVLVDYRSGELINRAFEVLQSSDTEVGLKSYCFHYILLWLDRYPELSTELEIIIRDRPELFSSGAMRSCLKKYHLKSQRRVGNTPPMR